ncbi:MULTISPECIES: hypothetical protein [Streptomyces]|uniref:hypothetical protein n=1 Tax=Streptomyces TaxID=1883 RepID=UPI0004CDAC18|nr:MULTISPECIES: hypothetical protein [Streptomyces]KOT49945.1 hypothetical protein ADK43_35115 [Streptomyces rimosus subsp. rimosus]
MSPITLALTTAVAAYLAYRFFALAHGNRALQRRIAATEVRLARRSVLPEENFLLRREPLDDDPAEADARALAEHDLAVCQQILKRTEQGER